MKVLAGKRPDGCPSNLSIMPRTQLSRDIKRLMELDFSKKALLWDEGELYDGSESYKISLFIPVIRFSPTRMNKFANGIKQLAAKNGANISVDKNIAVEIRLPEKLKSKKGIMVYITVFNFSGDKQ